MNHNEFKKNAEIAVVKKMKDKETDNKVKTMTRCRIEEMLIWQFTLYRGDTRSCSIQHSAWRGGGGGALIM